MDFTPEALVKLYQAAQQLRMPYEQDWRLAARFMASPDYHMWTGVGGGLADGVNAGSAARSARQMQFDSTLPRALPKFVAILEQICTPAMHTWHQLGPSNPELKKIRAVREYFSSLTDIMFRQRYQPRARFAITQQASYRALGLYGTSAKFITKMTPYGVRKEKSLNYRNIPLACLFAVPGVDGHLDLVFRRCDMNAREAAGMFPNTALPEPIQTELKKPTPSEDRMFHIFHAVGINKAFDDNALDERKWPWLSMYVFHDTKQRIGDIEGYRTCPIIIPRIGEVGRVFGTSPAQEALASIGLLNAAKKTQIKHAQRTADPPLIAHDDGIMSRIDQKPGAVNFGGVDAQGRKLIDILPTGDFRPADELIKAETAAVNDSFLVHLFQILVETPQMTATEFLGRAQEKAALLAPFMGMLQSNDLAPMIDREIDVLHDLNLLPEMPPELREAQGEYQISYTTPDALARGSEGITNFFRMVDLGTNVAKATGDASHLDVFDFEAAFQDIGDRMTVPPTWLRTKDEIEGMRGKRQEMQGMQQAVDAAPGLAQAAKTAGLLGGGDKQAA